jgi:hypothetical protein
VFILEVDLEADKSIGRWKHYLYRLSAPVIGGKRYDNHGMLFGVNQVVRMHRTYYNDISIVKPDDVIGEKEWVYAYRPSQDGRTHPLGRIVINDQSLFLLIENPVFRPEYPLGKVGYFRWFQEFIAPEVEMELSDTNDILLSRDKSKVAGVCLFPEPDGSISLLRTMLQCGSSVDEYLKGDRYKVKTVGCLGIDRVEIAARISSNLSKLLHIDSVAVHNMFGG